MLSLKEKSFFFLKEDIEREILVHRGAFVVFSACLDELVTLANTSAFSYEGSFFSYYTVQETMFRVVFSMTICSLATRNEVPQTM